MTIVTNTASRKELAKAIGKELGIEAKYMGVPSCNYQIGQYILDKEGVLHGPDFEPLRSFLQRNGMLPEDDISLSGEPTVQEEEPAQENTADFVSVTVPADGITPLQLKNLIFMLYSKQYLIGKMTGGDLLNIPDFLEARLIEKTPETIADFLSLLDTAKEKGMTGFDFKDEKVTLTFRAHPDEPGRNMVYAMFTARILKAAREATRIFPEKQEP